MCKNVKCALINFFTLYCFPTNNKRPVCIKMGIPKAFYKVIARSLELRFRFSTNLQFNFLYFIKHFLCRIQIRFSKFISTLFPSAFQCQNFLIIY